MLRNMIGNMHPKSQPEEQIRQTAVVNSNLLVLSTTILHVHCRNPRWRKQQGIFCLRQLTHLVVLVLKQLYSLISAAYYCEIAASSPVADPEGRGQFGATAPPKRQGAPLIEMRRFWCLTKLKKNFNIFQTNNALHFVELQASRAGLWPSLLSIGINNATLS